MSDKKLLDAIRNKTARIGILGMGYVGLPLVRTFCKAGFSCLGFDIDTRKVQDLNAGRSYIKHIPSQLIRNLIAGRTFSATDRAERLRACDALIMCVPTPLNEMREPDMTYVRNTTDTIASILRKGQLVVLESTTYPGTTKEVLKPILEATGLTVEKDFFLAFSPEREDPGRTDHTTETIPKVVGGYGPLSRKIAVELYGGAISRVVPVSSCEVAEACKILENVYRCVNIALVNELKRVFAAMDIDVWEVINAAATKPFGFQPFYPGPGLGGHCIPIDPFYLSWKAKEYNQFARFIELSGEINTAMPDYVIGRLTEALNARRKAVNGSRILVLGLAYKKNVDDMRESPSIELIEKLRDLGAKVDYNDPYIPKTPKQREHDLRMKSVPLTAAGLKKYDCVLVATDHSDYDHDFICRHANLIVDTRNATAGVKGAAARKIVKA